MQRRRHSQHNRVSWDTAIASKQRDLIYPESPQQCSTVCTNGDPSLQTTPMNTILFTLSHPSCARTDRLPLRPRLTAKPTNTILFTLSHPSILDLIYPESPQPKLDLLYPESPQPILI